MKISAAGNTEVPAILALEQLGLTVTSRLLSREEMIWEASDNEKRYLASSPLELLGLVKLLQTRGENWRASDFEVEKYLPMLEGSA